MKSKKVALTLALFTGSSGSDRFYLGQKSAGWLTLIALWVVLPGIAYAVVHFNVFPNWTPFLLARFALPIVFHLYAGGRYLVMSDEKFKSQDQSNSKTLPLVLASIAIAIVLMISGNKLLSAAQVRDITKSKASETLSAEEMSHLFRTDEDAYRKQYDNKVLEIEGTVSILPGEDLETGSKYIELNGQKDDVFGIKCFFKKENSGNVDDIRAGDHVVVKGEAKGNILNNSIVIKITHPQTDPNQQQ